MRPRVRTAVVVLAVGALAACSGGDDVASAPAVEPTPTAGADSAAATTPVPSASPTAAPATPPPVPDRVTTPAELATAAVTLTRVSTIGNTTALATRPGDDRLFVTQRDGFVVAVTGEEGVPVLDLRDAVSTEGEGGLLGLDFSPDGRWLYLSLTDTAGDSRVDAYRLDGDRVDTTSGRTILAVEQPSPFHNGGAIVVDDRGDLWLGLGDGSSGQEPSDAARRLDTLLGSIVRITPQPEADPPYTVPADNPFVGREDARPEIVATGLRNPWRIAHDRLDGSVWTGDVGQYAVEEIDVLRPDALGADFGWNALEGDVPVEGGPPPPPDAVPPVHAYPHDDRCAVIGGTVYRGHALPALQGAYVYGDHCDGRVRALLVTADGVHHHELATLEALVGFGEDAAGELYAMSLTEGLHRIGPAAGPGPTG